MPTKQLFLFPLDVRQSAVRREWAHLTDSLLDPLFSLQKQPILIKTQKLKVCYLFFLTEHQAHIEQTAAPPPRPDGMVSLKT